MTQKLFFVRNRLEGSQGNTIIPLDPDTTLYQSKMAEKKLTIKAPDFTSGDRVYYNLPDSELGVGLVTQVVFILDNSEYEYLVSWTGAEPSWHVGMELSLEPVII